MNKSNQNFPKCPICSKYAFMPLCESNGYDIFRCVECACDFVWPMPDEEKLKAYYDGESYYQGNQVGGYANYDMDSEGVLNFFRDFLDNYPNHLGKTILDVGCAYGTHLAIAAERGWEAWGVEISDHAREVAMLRHGDKINVVSSLNELPVREFDLVVMFDVLEHMPDPYNIFIDLIGKGLIGEHTMVVITTPNARSSQAVADPVSWPYRYPPAHLVYYSADALNKFWSLLGMKDIDTKGIYPIESIEPSEYSDEVNTLNQKIKNYAGLVCVVTGFDSELHKVFKSKVLKMTDGAVFIALSEQLKTTRILNNRLQQQQQALKVQNEEVNHLTKELQFLRQTNWFKLHEAILTRPFRFLTFARVVYLIGTMLTPKAARDKLRPFILKVRRLKWGRLLAKLNSRLRKNNAYIVRNPLPTVQPRPRIVHVLANFMTGGSSRLVVDLIENLGQLYEQSAVTGYIPCPPVYTGLDITEYYLPESEMPFVKHFMRHKPVLIHMHYWGDSDESWYAKVMSAAEKLGIPVIKNINTPVAPLYSSVVQSYIYVSNYVRREFGRPEISHITIYPGSDFSHFKRNEIDKPANDCIGMVYRLEKDKLNENAIVPFILTVQKRPQTKVLIVGGGSLLESYKATVKKAGLTHAFEFTGYVSYETLPLFYSRMSVFIAPVWKESFGQVSPFAMSMGVPVVGYDVGAISEIVGDKSLLAPAGDAEALSDIVVHILDTDELRKRVGEQQQARAHSLFSIQSMIAQYANLYERLSNAEHKS